MTSSLLQYLSKEMQLASSTKMLVRPAITSPSRKNRSQQKLSTCGIKWTCRIHIVGMSCNGGGMSTRHLAGATGFSDQWILKKNKFDPFKIRLLQNLNKDDFDRCMQLCKIVTEWANHNVNLLFLLASVPFLNSIGIIDITVSIPILEFFSCYTRQILKTHLYLD